MTVGRTSPICRMLGPMPHVDVQVIAEKFATLEGVFDERTRRLWAAAEARAIGRGGISGSPRPPGSHGPPSGRV